MSLVPTTWQKGNASISYVLPYLTVTGALKTLVVEQACLTFSGQSKLPLQTVVDPFRDVMKSLGEPAATKLLFKLLLDEGVLLFPIIGWHL